MTGTTPFTCLRSGGFVAGSEAVEGGVVTVQYHRVDWVGLLELKQELLHGLNGVVATQVNHHLLNLKQIQTLKGLAHIIAAYLLWLLL